MIRIITISDTHGVSLAQLKSTIDPLIESTKKSEDTILFINAGDWIGANRLLSSTSNGIYDIAATQLLLELVPPQFSFFVVGNHDTLYGEPVF